LVPLTTLALALIVEDLCEPRLALPLLGYCAVLAGLSVIHSFFSKAKFITIVLERWVKFASPLWLIWLLTGDPAAADLLIGAFIVFPFGYTHDYAYRGYLRERLGLPENRRFLVYGAYYLILTIWFALGHAPLPFALGPTLSFIAVYAGLAALSRFLAPRLPMAPIDRSYNAHVAGEKRRLLTYGMVQLAVIILGGLYVIFA
jgi:hypothetical protein